MGTCVIRIGMCWSTKRRSASNGEVLTSLLVLLWIQVSFNEDVHLTWSCPIPVKYLFAEVCDIGKVDLVVWLLKPWSLIWAWMKRWIIVRLLRRWE